MMPSLISARPAFGREYRTKEEVLADWRAGKDFRNSTHGVRGTYFSIRTEFPPEVRFIQIRYNQLMDIVVINAQTGVEHTGEEF